MESSLHTADAALPSMTRALEVLAATFGFDAFRGQQAAAIECALGGRDCVVLMPTGGGKSLCYQVPPLVTGGCTLVVSPLIALMADQVMALGELGIPAACLNSSLSHGEQDRVVARLLAGELRLIYVAPERLVQAQTAAVFERAAIDLIAIDEAHCVSQWGHDFRSDYLALGALRQRFPGVPRMALTATADERTRGDIIARLELDRPALFVGGFDRPNIRYSVRPRANGRDQLARFLESHRGEAGIVYCMSRRKVEQTAEWLSGMGFTALPYHAGLDGATREQHQRRFVHEDGVVIVATIAFGMGIDKPDVRFVAHLDLPKSVEAYYQETGRAGRDGEAAEAWMVYGLEDVVRLRQMLEESEAAEEHKRIERHKLDALLGWCEVTGCRRGPLLGYFGETQDIPCGNCDNCLQPPGTWDATEAAQKLLSCVYRTGQRFGAAHVIDVLRGADTEKVRQHRHHELSTYGIGDAHSNKHWRSVLRQLMVRGDVVADVEAYGALKLTDQARALLRGDVTLMLREDTFADGGAKRRAPVDDLAPEDQAVFERLRACRKQLAEDAGVPPYVVFHDTTLKDMAVARPRTSAELLGISGVGTAKLERYGQAFLDAVAAGE